MKERFGAYRDFGAHRDFGTHYRATRTHRGACTYNLTRIKRSCTSCHLTKT